MSITGTHDEHMWQTCWKGSAKLIFPSSQWSKEDEAVPHQDLTWKPTGLLWKLRQNLWPRPPDHLVSIIPTLSNETWPALEEKWIMGSSINTIFPSLKLHTWSRVVRCHVLKLLLNSFTLIYCSWCSWLCNTACGFISSDSSQTDHFFSLSLNVRTTFNLLLTWRNPYRGILGGEVAVLQGKLGSECFVTMVDNFTSWWTVCWVIWRCL